MRVKWKKLFLWSSLASVAAALAISVARKANKPRPPAPRFEPIPPDCIGIVIRTEGFTVEENGKRAEVWDEYRVQPTPFKVWNVLELQPQPASTNPQGSVIYHISHARQTHPASETGELVERFYGTIRSIDPESGAPRKNELARGAVLEIPRCYVGGASNGVETGEVHRSRAPVLDFQFQS